MRKIGIIAVLSLMVTALAAVPALAAIQTSTNFANAPNGAHFVGTPTVTCSVSSNGTITCPTQTVEIAGVGGADANLLLTTSYSATVDCFNPADTKNRNNPIESHTDTFTATPLDTDVSPKNGRLTLTPVSVSQPSAASFQGQADCPNTSWTPRVRAGSVTLQSFTYTVTFEGFTAPVITITGP
jgi:hypothetical protein